VANYVCYPHGSAHRRSPSPTDSFNKESIKKKAQLR
jgi:hypothetical protein